MRRADQTGELRVGDFSCRRHWRPPRKRGKGRDLWAAASRGNREEPLRHIAYHDRSDVKPINNSTTLSLTQDSMQCSKSRKTQAPRQMSRRLPAKIDQLKQ